MSFDDDDKDMYVNYLQSFFRQGSKYVVWKREVIKIISLWIY
jgi:hypothetical protein